MTYDRVNAGYINDGLINVLFTTFNGFANCPCEGSAIIVIAWHFGNGLNVREREGGRESMAVKLHKK